MIDIHEISPEGKDQVSVLAAERSTSNPLLVGTPRKPPCQLSHVKNIFIIGLFFFHLPHDVGTILLFFCLYCSLPLSDYC